jgi:quinoprotein glucose dehydrogenase
MNAGRTRTWLRCGYAVLLALFGIAIFVEGAVLAFAGGSVYYMLAGAAMSFNAVLLWRGHPRAAWLYAVFLFGTLIWALWEVGSAGWGLTVRLATLIVLGLPLLLRSVRGPDARGPVLMGLQGVPLFLGSAAAAIVLGSGAHALRPDRDDPLMKLGTLDKAPDRLTQPLADIPSGDWLHHGNDQGGTRFSPLEQITPENVSKLEVAWEADVGPADPNIKSALQVTPLHVDGALYVCNGYNTVLSFDAETGSERWRFNMTRDAPPSGEPCRGAAYYRVPDATGECSTRIYSVSQSADLFAIDAATGSACPSFGDAGLVRLREGMGEVPAGYHYVSSAPQVVRGKLVMGGAVMDGQFWGEPPGVIRAFDAITGKLAWAFDAGRQTNDAGTDGQAYTPATPNNWAPISADESLGLVYLPTGNATPDFYGAQRRPFDEELSSSVIALDAETGALRWRFQTVHHDIWDYDVPSQPTLVDLPTPTGVRKALIQPTKRGEIFVLDRITGEPIKTVEEVAVPQDGIAPGERLSPTQPFSAGMPSFRPPKLRESDMWGITPFDHMLCRLKFKQSRYEGTLTPVSLEAPTILDPGYSGGVNWGSVSVNVDRGIMVVNWMRLPTRVELLSREAAGALALTAVAPSRLAAASYSSRQLRNDPSVRST